MSRAVMTAALLPCFARTKRASMLENAMLRNAAIACLVFALAACHPAEQPSAVGTWRAVLTSPGGELPFTLRIVRQGARPRAIILKGSEQVRASRVDVRD